jgi:serine protease Do
MDNRMMKERIGKVSSWLRYALLGGAIIVACSSRAFSRLTEAKEHPKIIPARLVVDDTPVQREGKGLTSFAPVVKHVAPSVVKVFTTTKAKQQRLPSFFDDPLFRRFFGEDGQGDDARRSLRTPKQYGLGSGVVVTKDGYILTNNHVVENADEIKVGLNDGRELPAKVVGADSKSDVAVLKIDASDLTPLPLADSDKIEVGDIVLAVGNPFGIGQTVTMGIISATGRSSLGFGLDYEDFIQTDAAINPGNSGGALMDAEGRLIGINTAILSRSGGNQGIGFAIPSNLARGIMESLIKNGRVIRGYMGVGIQDVTPSLAKEFNVAENSGGALVTEVRPKSPAEKAGLQNGDVITEIDGKPVKDSRHLKLQVAALAPGTEVPLKIIRDGESKTVNVTLKEFPKDEAQARRGAQPEKDSSSDTLDGVTVGDIDGNARRQLGLPTNLKGALVVQVDENSASYEAGLREGDVILEINRKKVTSADDAVELSDKIKEKNILLRVWSNGGSHYLVVNEDKKADQ